jgi:signal-transduction protein with cAMP-binding, CBS, and nucleotidyltransferase domain
MTRRTWPTSKEVTLVILTEDTVADWMTRDPVTASVDTMVPEAHWLMLMKKIEHLTIISQVAQGSGM